MSIGSVSSRISSGLFNMPNMVVSMAPRQTILEEKISALGSLGTQRLCAVLVSVVVGVASAVSQTSGARSDPVFMAQSIVVGLAAAASPLLVHHPLDLTRPLLAFGLALFTATAAIPVLFAMLYHLFLGHTTIKDPQWYHALWRIYAILGLWMLFAVINEAKVRPWFRARALRRKDEAQPSAAPNSVAGRADAMRRAARTEKLTALRESLVAAKARRDTAQAAVDGAEATAATAKENVAGATKLVAASEDKMKSLEKDAEGYAVAAQERDTMRALLNGAKAHEKGLDAQKAAHELMLAESCERIKDLDEKWKHWSNLDNYPFYR